MSPTIVNALAIVFAYLLGSISFGIVTARSQGVDIREEGSGNPGVSNVMRVLGTKSAALVLLGDGTKGVIAAWVGSTVGGPEFGYLTLFAAVVGHAFPIWHRFNGGKSVATTLGGIIFLAPVVGVVFAAAWLVIVVVWKTASIASIAVMILLTPGLWIAGRSGVELVLAAVISVFVLTRHTGNIKRLLTSSERKVAG